MGDTAHPSETPKVGDGSVRSGSSMKHAISSESKDAESWVDVRKEKHVNGNGAASPPGGVICDFYAKGWCIKGSSCRFLHIKDNQRKNNFPTPAEGDAPREGLGEHGQGSTPPNYCPQAVNDAEGGGIKRQCGSMNECGDHGSLFRDRFHPGLAVSSRRDFGNPLSQSNNVEELTSFQHVRPNNQWIESFMRDSSNSSSSASVTATGALLSNGISTWTGSSLPFSYSSISTTSLDSIPSSLHHGSFHFSGSKPDKLPPAKRKISSNDWEPSVPFRPSFVLLSMISISGSLYDPLRDSVESPKVGDASWKPSLHCQGSSIENASIHQNNGLSRNDDTMSVSSHNTNHGKDTRAVEVEAVGTSTGMDYRTTRKQENSLGSSVVKDITEATSDIRPQNRGSGNSAPAKADSISKNYHTDAGSNLDQSVNKESREIRQFRAALIEYVKELLKPKWRDGQISKAAHNKIVKKAVEKVLSTLPLEQLPASMEATQQYLAASRGKIDKLVEGYAEIYGKL